MEPNQKMLRKRKMLLVLPALVTPFIIMLFWALGGGQGAAASSATKGKGLDMNLPGLFKQDDNSADKLSFYQQAEKDSAQWNEQLRTDPYHIGTGDAIDTGSPITVGDYRNYGVTANTLSTYTDPNEEKVNQKLTELYRQLNQGTAPASENYTNSAMQDEMSKMKAMMRSMNAQNAIDPEMQQLNGMLEKILYIEHPEMAKEKMREQSLKNKKQVYTVMTTASANDIQLIEGQQRNGHSPIFETVTYSNRKHKRNKPEYTSVKENSFYQLSDDESNKPAGNTIEAEVAETSTLVNGSTIKLKLLNDIYINGTLIPKEQFVFGTCNISGDRLLVNLSSIRFSNSIFPVELSAYDMDGIAGVNIPDAVSRQVAKGSAGSAVNGIDVFTYDNTVKGQAISAGVQAAKGLFSRKAQIVRVTVKQGYRVLLKNTNDL